MKRVLALLFLFLSVVTTSIAQAPPPSGSPPSSFVGAPVDEHAWVLAFITLLFGVYTLTTQRRRLRKAKIHA